MDPELEWRSTRVDGVVLIAVTVDNPAAVPRRVRVENRLDGPVLPPRSGGVPEAGWDREGYEGVVPAAGRLALGYACPRAGHPAPLATPPVELASAERAHSDEDGGDADVRPTETETRSDATNAAAAARELGRGTPPRDAVPDADDRRPFRSTSRRAPTPAPASEPAPVPAPESGGSSPSDEGGASGRPECAPTRRDDGRSVDGPARRSSSSGAPSRHGAADGAGSPPEDVEAWFDAVESRVGLAESLTDPCLPAATRALGAAGGLEPAASAVRQTERDAEALRRVADRAEALAERAEATDVPLDALRRLA